MNPVINPLDKIIFYSLYHLQIIILTLSLYKLLSSAYIQGIVPSTVPGGRLKNST